VLDAVADGTVVAGGRGRFMVRDRHAEQPVYLARADGLDFDVIASAGSDASGRNLF
jgi:urea transport system substrate-binding protein